MWKKIIKNLPRIIRTAILWMAVVAFVVFLLYWVGIEEVISSLKTLEPKFALAGCFCIIVVQMLKALRFSIMTKLVKNPVCMHGNILAHLIVPIVGMLTPGKLGEGMKVLMLGGNRASLMHVFFVERLFDLGVLLISAAMIIERVPQFLSIYVTVTVVFIIIAGALVKGDWIVNYIKHLLSDRLHLPDNWFNEQVIMLLKPSMIIVLIITCMTWATNFLAIYYFTIALHIELSFIAIVSIFSCGIIAGIVSGIPGGSGARELGVIVIAESVYNVPQQDAAALALLNMSAHYLTLGAIAIIAMPFYQKYRRNLI